MMGDIYEVEGKLNEGCGITPRIFEYLFARIRVVCTFALVLEQLVIEKGLSHVSFHSCQPSAFFLFPPNLVA